MSLSAPPSRRPPVKRPALTLVGGLCTVVALASCGHSGAKAAARSTTTSTAVSTSTVSTSTTTTGPQSTTSTTVPAAKPVSLTVFFVRGNTLGAARRFATKSVHLQALRDVMAGPSAAEKAEGLTSAMPPGSAVEGYSLVKGVAYVDCNPAFFERTTESIERQQLAEITYTITSFPGTTSVQFLEHGSKVAPFGGVTIRNPVSPDALLGAVGPVLLTSPAASEVPHPSIVISGQSEFNGTMQIELLSSSRRTILSSASTATTGETFSYHYPLPKETSPSTLRVYAAPATGQTQLVASVRISPSS